MNIRRTATVLGIAMFGAATFLGTGVADATQSESHTCLWSTHWQDGQCTTVQVDQWTDHPIYFTVSCPSSHPHPFLASFSPTPIWIDLSRSQTGTHEKGFAAFSEMKPVILNGSQWFDVSYMGTGKSDPGYVRIYTDTWFKQGSDAAWYSAGSFECADKPAFG
ncbi:hypothetical protein LQL77_31470 [Rhodococcus cerastii]|nr:hypothetical protein [Rhodococcus cerastii]